jgi:hypothetical protein
MFTGLQTNDNIAGSSTSGLAASAPAPVPGRCRNGEADPETMSDAALVMLARLLSPLTLRRHSKAKGTPMAFWPDASFCGYRVVIDDSAPEVATCRSACHRHGLGE